MTTKEKHKVTPLVEMVNNKKSSLNKTVENFNASKLSNIEALFLLSREKDAEDEMSDDNDSDNIPKLVLELFNVVNESLIKEKTELEKDSQGNELSAEQTEFFKDSVVRDSNNRLLVVYHGTGDRFADETFKYSIKWFTPALDYAKGFSRWLGLWADKAGHTYVCYLNCKNVFDCGVTDGPIFELAPIKPHKFSSRFESVFKKLSVSEKTMRDMIEEVAKEYDEKENGYKMRIHVLTRSNQFKNLLVKKGYDGLKCVEFGHDTFGVFNSNQIKKIKNKNPTNSNNINESESSKETLTRDKIENKVMKKLGTSSTPVDGPSYIMKDGSFLKVRDADVKIRVTHDAVNREESNRKAIHSDIDYYIHTNITSWQNAQVYYLNYDCIRVNNGWERYMVLPSVRPNEAQFNSLLVWLDYYFTTHNTISVDVINTRTSNNYDKDEYIPEEIIKKIKRYYTTGTLVEKTNKYEELLKSDDPKKLLKACGKYVYHATYKKHLNNIKENGLSNFWFGIDVDECLQMIEFNHKEYEEEIVIEIPTKLLSADKCDFTQDNGDGWSDNWAGTCFYRDTLSSNQLIFYAVDDDPTQVSSDILINNKNSVNIDEDLSTVDNEENELSKEQDRFFKNSKVRDSQGKLLVLYHGTQNSFDTFKFSTKNNSKLKFGKAFYFSDDLNIAKDYSEGKLLMSCYLNLQNPLIVNAEGAGVKSTDHTNEIKKYIEDNNMFILSYLYEVYFHQAKKERRDGIIVHNIIDNHYGSTANIRPSNVYIAFHENQIKSIDNKNPTSSNNINENTTKEIIVYRGEERSRINRFDNVDTEGNIVLYNDVGFAGLFFSADSNDVRAYGISQKFSVSNKAKIYEGYSSEEYCFDNNLRDIKDDVLYKISDGHTLKEIEELFYNKGLDDMNSLYGARQYMARKHLEKLGYDGAHWEYEDDLTPEQYQIWNSAVIKYIRESNDINEELDIPRYLYHATYKPFLKSIKEKGLGNTRRKMWTDSVRGVVYLADDEDVAYSYAESSEWLDDVEDYDKYADNIIVLKIDTNKLDKTKLKRDDNVIDGDSTFEYHGIITFDFIEEIMVK